MEELINELREFAKERDWEQFHSPKNLAMALSVEVAEIVEIFQWLTQEESKNLSQEKVEKVKQEIGDVMIFLTNLADKFGIDPLDAAREKIEMNRLKYPAELVKGRANKYTEYEE
jgi:dCTP diphosphatase